VGTAGILGFCVQNTHESTSRPLPVKSNMSNQLGKGIYKAWLTVLLNTMDKIFKKC